VVCGGSVCARGVSEGWLHGAVFVCVQCLMELYLCVCRLCVRYRVCVVRVVRVVRYLPVGQSRILW
jgi:hypothetical protein